jgi:hypothetical protein
MIQVLLNLIQGKIVDGIDEDIYGDNLTKIVKNTIQEKELKNDEDLNLEKE